MNNSVLWMWKIHSESEFIKVDFFNSECEMQSFIMNRPEVIGCWNLDKNLKTIRLLKELQIGERKRADLIGITKKENEKGYELKIIELKNKKIGSTDIEQLKEYLDSWKYSDKTKLKVKEWIKKILGLDEKDIIKMINSPVGVIIAPAIDFKKVVMKAVKYNIKVIRFMKFKSEKSSDQYLVMEDIIGSIVTHAKRQQVSWRDLIEKGLIRINDELIISPLKSIELKAKIDQDSIDDKHQKSIIFYKESAEILLKNIEKNQKEINEKYPYLIRYIHSLKNEKSISITSATGLVSIAFGGKPTKSFWVPLPYWYIKRTGESLYELFEKYKKETVDKYDV